MKTIFLALRKVFGSFNYWLIATAVGFLFLLLIIWLPNLRLLSDLLFSSKTDLLDKIKFIFGSFAILNNNFSLAGKFFSLLISLLAGLNTALFIYYLKEQRLIWKSGGVGFLGMVSGLLGVGCASCGSIFLSLLGFSGAVAVLPFHGQEFNFLAIGLLSFSLYESSKKIISKTCNIY